MNPPLQPRRSRAARHEAGRPFIEETTHVRVRFNEVDTLRIVWHGHYVNYLEEARRALGRRLGIDYPVFLEQHVAVPVIHLELDFLAPANMTDTLAVTARLFKSDSARLDYTYEIRREGETALLAAGRTSQVFTTPAGELILNWPPFMLERLRAWESLWQQP
jgi:acyl-CoA thioester hydrolase